MDVNMSDRDAGAYHIKRLNELKSIRSPLEAHWRKAYDATYPLRGERLNQIGVKSASESVASSARAKQAIQYDSTTRNAVRLLASTLIGGLTPQHTNWIDFKNLAGKNEPDISHNEREWLDLAAKTVWRNIHSSNYDYIGYECFIDYVIAGMFALYIEEGKGGKPYNFKQWPLYSIYCADSTGKGVVDTVYRDYQLTAEQAIAEFGAEVVSGDIIKSADKEPDKIFDFVQCVYPRVKPTAMELPIASLHIDVKSKKIMRDTGYNEMPVVVPRWMLIPDSVYSVGIIDDALPDHLTLNKVIEFVLQNAEIAIAGMWAVNENEVSNAKSIKLGPRKIIPVTGGRDSMWPLVPGTKFDVAMLEIERLQKSITKTLLSDQLQPQDGPAMTATEVNVKTQLTQKLIVPLFGRLNPELNEGMVKRCFNISIRRGDIPPPPESLRDKVVDIRYTSPLAKSQRLDDIGAIERFEMWITAALAAGIEAPLEITNIDVMTRAKADYLGLPASYLRPPEEVEKLRKDKARAIEQAKMEERRAAMGEKIVPQMLEKGMSQ